MVDKRSSTGTSDTNAPINIKKRKSNTIQANLVTETPAEVEAESVSVTTAKLVEDSGEPYTDHHNFDKHFLDETVKSNSFVIPFDKLVDKILLFDLEKSSPWSSRGTPAKPTLHASRISPSQHRAISRSKIYRTLPVRYNPAHRISQAHSRSEAVKSLTM